MWRAEELASSSQRARDKNWRAGRWHRAGVGLVPRRPGCPVADPSLGGKSMRPGDSLTHWAGMLGRHRAPQPPQCQANSKTTCFLLLIPGAQPAGPPAPPLRGGSALLIRQLRTRAGTVTWRQPEGVAQIGQSCSLSRPSLSDLSMRVLGRGPWAHDTF